MNLPGMTAPGKTSPDFCSNQAPSLPHRLWHLVRDGSFWLGRWIECGFDWYARHHLAMRQRRDLACYDDHMLKDIGLSRADIEQEISKSFWQC